MNRTVILGLIGAVIVVLALLLNDFLSIDPAKEAEKSTEETAEATPSSPDEDSSAASDDGAEAPDSVSSSDDTSSSEQPSGSVTTDDTPDVEPSGDTADRLETVEDTKDAPSFDVVRISREGDTVIAGRAEPGAIVRIYDGEEEIGSVEADARGEWVYLPSAPLKPGSHDLSLATETPGEAPLRSENAVVLVVPEAGKNVAGEEVESGGEALAVLVPKDPDALTTRVLQKPSGKGVSASTGDLAVDSVDYDDKGAVSVGGRGKPGSTVRTYLDNEPVGEAVVDESGRWNVKPDDDITEGVYSLRVDAVDEGSVVARLELPFSKSKPLLDFKGDNFVIVQPGNSLWRIARRVLGSGYHFSVIYEANRDQIRDPDLIYPGQIMEVPAN